MSTHQAKSFGLALLIHAALIVLMMFWYITSPIPPWEEGLAGGGGGGSFVEFGTVEFAPEPEPSQALPSPPEEPNEDELLSSELEKSIAVPIAEKPKKKASEKPVKNPVKTEPKSQPTASVSLPKVEEKKPDPRALYKPGKKGNTTGGGSTPGGDGGQGNGSGGGEGDGSGPGSGGGSGGGDGGGRGPGSGMYFDLAGRSMRSAPKIEDTSQEQGKVVIDITVDKYGNVSSANGPGRGSTTTSQNLVKKAKEAALRTKFSPSPNGVEEQKGKITFNFVLN